MSCKRYQGIKKKNGFITFFNCRQTTVNPNDGGALSPEEFYNYMTKFSLYYLYIGCGVLVAAFIQVTIQIVTYLKITTTIIIIIVFKQRINITADF